LPICEACAFDAIANQVRRACRASLMRQVPRDPSYFDFLRLGDPRRPAPAAWPILAGSNELSDKRTSPAISGSRCARSEADGLGSDRSGTVSSISSEATSVDAGWSGTVPPISSEAAGVDADWSGTLPPISWRLAQASHFSQFSCSSALACSKDAAMPATRMTPAAASGTPLMAQSHWESDLSGVSLL
jgi:hypothetical protein